VDAVLLSFGRGKPLALGGGGALLHDGPALAAPRRSGGGWGRAASLVATTVLSRPLWFRIPESIPLLGIGETVYDPSFPMEAPFFEWQAALGLRALERFPGEARRRGEHARHLLAAIDGVAGWSASAAARAEGPIRLPLLAPDRHERDRVLVELRRLGVRASRMYPGTLADIAQLRPHLANPAAEIPGARALADRLITLPIYPTLARGDLERVATAFRATARRGAR
jgi:dTDP-4-amino-4,6-dideoxygalactose transaminase